MTVISSIWTDLLRPKRTADQEAGAAPATETAETTAYKDKISTEEGDRGAKLLESFRQGRQAARRQVLALLGERHPELLSGQRGVTLSREEVSQFTAELQRVLPSYSYKTAVQFLALGFEKGSAYLGWRVPMPAVPVVFAREPSGISPANFRGLSRLRKLERKFLKSLEREPDGSPDVRLGQLLFSAIVFGGLLSKSCLEPWWEALRKRDLHVNDKGLCLNMAAEAFSGPVPTKTARKRRALRGVHHEGTTPATVQKPVLVCRRWFADPLTEILVMRWLAYSDREQLLAIPSASPSRCLEAFIETLDVGRAAAFASTTSFLTWAATRARLVIPPYLVEYAACRTASVSVSGATWARIRLGKAVPVDEKSKVEGVVSEGRDTQAHANQGPFHLEQQPELLREILHILRRPGQRPETSSEKCRRALNEVLEAKGAMLAPVLYYLVSWGLYLLLRPPPNEQRRFHVKRLNPASVSRYFAAVAWPLLESASAGDIVELTADEIEELYRDIIAAKVTLRDKAYTADRLVAFHEFLASRFAAPAINYSEIRGGGLASEHGVDANLVSFRDFQNLLKVIGGEKGGRKRKSEIRALIAILGFYGGLRRQEALTLRMGDIMGDVDPAVLVRSNRYARVKSIASHRIIPVRPLMPPHIANRILRWVRRRVNEDRQRCPDHLLFCVLGQPKVPLLAADVFDPITKALHQVTGDLTLRFHHLRHAFATWTLSRVMRQATPGLADRFSSRKRPHANGLMSDESIAALFGATAGRRLLYGIATLCGHASPGTTILHYLHLCDWLLSRALADPAAQPRVSHAAIHALARALSLKVPASLTGNDDGKGILIAPLLPAIRKAHQEKFRDPYESKAQKANVTRLPDPPVKLPPWRLVELILTGLEAAKTAVALEAAYGVPVTEIGMWAERASQIREMKTRKGELRHADKSGRVFSGRRLDPLDRCFIEQIFDQVNGLPPASRYSLRRGCDLFLTGYYSTGASDVRFTSFGGARSYQRFLYRLGIRPHEVGLVHYPREGQTTSEAETHRKLWADALGLAPEQVKSRGKGNETAGDKRGFIGLRVVPDPGRLAQQGKRRTGRDRMANPALRHAILLLAVVLGTENLSSMEPNRGGDEQTMRSPLPDAQQENEATAKCDDALYQRDMKIEPVPNK